MKVVESLWYTTIGIVVGESSPTLWKTYMRNVMFPSTQKADEIFVLENGYKIPLEAACGFFPHLVEQLREKAER